MSVASRTFFVHRFAMSEGIRAQYKFMIPLALKAKLEEAAHANRRSMSAEVIARLEASFDGPATDEVVAALDASRLRLAVFSALFETVNIDKLIDQMSDESGDKLDAALQSWREARKTDLLPYRPVEDNAKRGSAPKTPKG